MKISQNLPQFENNPTLIITSGWQAGKVFYAVNGEIVLNKEIKVPDHKYSDREGHFKTRTGTEREALHSGATYEEKKKHIRDEFLNKLSEHVKDLVHKHKIKSIYIFSSQEGIKSLKKELPSEVVKLIKKIYKGNYIHHAPDKLIKLIKNRRPQPVKVMKEEAKKILDRTKNIFRRGE